MGPAPIASVQEGWGQRGGENGTVATCRPLCVCPSWVQQESCNTCFAPTFAYKVQLSRGGRGASSERRLAVLEQVCFLLCCADEQPAVVDVRAIVPWCTKACPFPPPGP